MGTLETPLEKVMRQACNGNNFKTGLIMQRIEIERKREQQKEENKKEKKNG